MFCDGVLFFLYKKINNMWRIELANLALQLWLHLMNCGQDTADFELGLSIPIDLGGPIS